MCKYDVFISHNSDNKPWVTALAQNLKDQGIKVFLDSWCLIPGRSIVKELDNGLKQSLSGIVVVTPEAFESGWVMKEYEKMIHRTNEDSKFSIIPVILGKEIPDFPFLETFLWVDFRDPAYYRQSFYRLVCAIEKIPPKPNIKFKKEPVIVGLESTEVKSTDPADDFVSELMELFFNKQTVALLVQDGRWQEGVKSQILEMAVNRYGKTNVLYLVPPFNPLSSMEEYFSFLGKQCGSKHPITDLTSLISAFEEKLKGEKPLFLMITGFENSGREEQKQLAAVLRHLNERFQELRILISGGEKLADLIYGGELAYFNHAEIAEWPELNQADVIQRAKSGCAGQEIDINKNVAKRFLKLSGGHPKILDTCFDLYRKNKRFNEDQLIDKLLESPFLHRLLIPFLRDTAQKKRICQVLEEFDVAPKYVIFSDPLIKSLYWRNLIKKGISNSRLYWRSQTLQTAAKQIIGC